MTINNSANKVIAAGNGVMTVFNFSFVGVEASDIAVIYTNASGVETTLTPSQYALVLNAVPPGQIWGIGGTVTYPLVGSPIALNTTLTIVRTLPLTQEVALGNQGNEFPSAVETALDLIEMQLQQVSEVFQRAIVAPVVDPSTINLTLPPAAQRANTGIAFDGSGNVIAGTTPATGIISTVMQPVVDASTLAIGRAAFGLGTMATEGIGSGLIDDGAGNARVNNPIVQVASSQTVTAGFDLERFVATGPINFNLNRANTYWNGFGFWLQAVGGDVTLVPNAADTINGTIASGTSLAIPAGASVFVTTDAASTGIWYVNGIPWLVQQPLNCTGTRNITATDNAKILVHNSGAFGTFIFPNPATLPTNFRCLIMNGETASIGKGVGGTNLGSFTMYPSQSYVVINNNGTMEVVGGKLPWVKSSVALFCNNAGGGSDNPLLADGLADGTRAKVTQQAVKAQLYGDFLHNGSPPTITLTGAFAEQLTLSGQPPGAPVFFWSGSSPGAYTIQEVGGASLIMGDGVVCEMANVFWEGNNNTAVGIQMHQTAILDILSGCTFGNYNAGSHVSTDGAGWTLNVDAGYTISNAGNARTHMGALGAGVINISGAITITINGGPAPAMTDWFTMDGPCLINMGLLTFVGTPQTGCKQYGVGPAALLSTGGNTIPGSIGGTPAGFQVPTGSTGWVN